MDFAGRVALITGGGSGIGQAAAHLFARGGGSVFVADIDAQKAKGTADAIARAGGRAEIARCDVTQAVDVQAAFEAAERLFGRLDAVVHCAGILRSRRIEDSTEAEWDEVVRVNLHGAFLVTRAAMAALRRHGGGGIVHMASRMSIRVKEAHGAYAAAKAGVMQLTRMAALEGAPAIRANCVLPGFVDSPMTRGSGPKADVDAQFAGWARACPLGRAGTPEDIANAICFLLSDAAAFITGVALPVDGGRTIL